MVADTSTMTDILLDSVREIFETMIFMSVETIETEPDSGQGDGFFGSITFKGALQGCLGISYQTDGAKAVAAGMLCLDSPDEVEEADMADAIGEVCNMVLGSIKTRVQDAYPNFELSIPSVVAGRAIRSNLGDSTEAVANVRVGEQHDIRLSLVFSVPAES